MFRAFNRVVLTLLLILMVSPSLPAQGVPATSPPTNPTDQASVRAALAQFDKSYRNWKVRMTSLVTVVKADRTATPLLLEALEKGSPSAREFAVQALSVVADPQSQAALTRALEDPDQRIRVYALRALSRLGPVKLTERQREILENKAHWMFRHYIASLLVRENIPDPREIQQALVTYDLGDMDTAHVGRAAPDFALKDNEGKTHRLGDFRGKKMVLLEFNLGDN